MVETNFFHDIFRQKSDVSSIDKRSTEESSDTPNRSSCSKLKYLKPTKRDYVLICLNCVMVAILIILPLVLPKITNTTFIDNEEILLVQYGSLFGASGGEHTLNDATHGKLTFRDTIRRVTGGTAQDQKGSILLFHLLMQYSNGKSGNMFGGLGPQSSLSSVDSLDLDVDEVIEEVIVYKGHRFIDNPYQGINGTELIVGIHFKTNREQTVLFGSNNGTAYINNRKGYFLGFIRGKTGGYIDSIGLTWYRHVSVGDLIET